jgi:hypothetical protein
MNPEQRQHGEQEKFLGIFRLSGLTPVREPWYRTDMANTTKKFHSIDAALAACDAAFAAKQEAQAGLDLAIKRQADIHALVAKEVNLWSDEDLNHWLGKREQAAAERRFAASVLEFRCEQFAAVCNAARDEFDELNR